MASVEIANVTKAYGQLETIKGVSVEVPDGSFVVLVGPSGCGKSTLLRMIAGLEDITGGEIRIGGRVVNDVEPKHRDIAMVFQNYALYPHMTIAENMGFSLRLAKKPAAEIQSRVAEAARMLGLSDYLDRYPKQLSGGQRQRVAMGRAVVRNPQVFLFDEPLSNLDAKLRVQMRAELKELHARLKTTTIYVTHDQIEAMTMADKIVVMKDGLIEQVGSPLELYDHPANIFVASFIGSPSMNFIKGKVSADQKYVQTKDGIILHLNTVTSLSNGDEVTFGIRPEHLTLTDEQNGIPVTITNLEPTGSDTFIQGMVGNQKIEVQLHQRLSARAGDVVHLGYSTDNVHLFDSATGIHIKLKAD